MQPGTRVGHFEIVSCIGRGGMGEVFRARDLKLRREVALKTLPPDLAGDADRLARLEREATSLATLNHPNIASIHGLEEHGTGRFLVLELIEGPTLQDLLLAGPMGVERALKIAQQIAEALEAAHERGVIHRDLKPANIKITPDERVKVLDFGLAKNLSAARGNLPTQTSLHTALGTVMGTPPYMSPEQARGEEVGRQTDIWSLGVVLYEMLTGRLPFGGNSGAEILGRVLEARPDLTLLPPGASQRTSRLLERCLEKDRRRRLQHAGDVRIELEDALAAPAAAVPTLTRSSMPLIAAAVAAAALTGVAGWQAASRTAAEAPRAPVRLSTSFSAPATWQPYGTRHLAISSDGSRIAYAATRSLFVRRLREPTPIEIQTDGIVHSPFFSPSGESVGFLWNGIWTAPSAGGAPTQLAAFTERPAGASWGADGTIVFATSTGIYQVAENGGDPQLLVQPEPTRRERLYAWPEHLPGGRALLFTVFSQTLTDPPLVGLLDLETLESRIVVNGGAAARYAPTGHLVYAAGSSLRAQPFNLDRLETRGDAFAIPDIAIATSDDNAAAQFAFSDTGTLLFAASVATTTNPLSTLAWVDRAGAEEPIPIAADNYAHPRVSPDGSFVAVGVTRAGNRDVWIVDLNRAALTRLTTAPAEDLMPLWGGDGSRVYFGSNRTGDFDVFSQAADGSSEARVVLAAPGFQTPVSLTPDGDRIIVIENFRDLNMLNITEPVIAPMFNDGVSYGVADVSPDGRWIAYESLESGEQFEIFVRPFPDVGRLRTQISLDGGRFPRWGASGSGELFYVTPDGDLLAVAVDVTPELRVGTVTKQFDIEPPPSFISPRTYDTSPIDGRFLVIRPLAAAQTGSTVSVVIDWFRELEAHAR
jgi:serine/threonine protein kinase